jgi:hypothetical protein
VLGHRRLADGEPVDEVADRALAVAQEVEDLPAGRLGEDGEAHGLSMRFQLYSCQGI